LSKQAHYQHAVKEQRMKEDEACDHAGTPSRRTFNSGTNIGDTRTPFAVGFLLYHLG